MDSTVVFGHDVPTRLRLPGNARGVPAEQVGSRRIMGRPHDFLLRCRQVSRETLDAFRTHPEAPISDFDVLEHVGDGELLLLALRSFVVVVGERGDVDESGDAVIGPCGGDDASTIGMPTRMDGLVTRPNVRFTVTTSCSGVSRPYCAATTWCPSA